MRRIPIQSSSVTPRPRPTRPPRPTAVAIATAAAVVGLVLALGPAVVLPRPAGAAGTAAPPVIEVWKASLGPSGSGGSSGANGAATLTVTATGTGTVSLSLKALKPAARYVASIRQGTCTKVGPTLAALPTFTATKGGRASSKVASTAAQVAAIRSELHASGKVVVRVGSGSLARCGPLKLLSRSPRVGSVTVRLQAPDGSPVASVPVSYRQTTHDFLFGVGMTAPDSVIPLSTFEGLAQIGVNYAFPFTSWSTTEPESGTFNWSNVDYSYRPTAMRGLGYTLDGGSLIFFLPESWNLPAYVRAMDFEQLKAAVTAHVGAVVRHYAGTIEYWTITEPTWPDSNPFHLTKAQWVEIVRAASEAIRAADPTAKIMVVVIPLDLPERGYSATGILDALVKGKVEFDAIGIEVYPFAFGKDSNGYPIVSQVSARLDDFARFGKPLFISEMGIPATPSPEAQAAWLRAIYGMAFEKSLMAGLVWYFVVDDPFLPGAGLFPDAASPARPTYQALADVIAQRTTAATTATDRKGVVRIEGYAGDYLVEVGGGPAPRSFTIHIAEGQDRTIVAIDNGGSISVGGE